MSVNVRVVQAFTERYGVASAVLVRAPGRVNLIGEHTDYNDGFVLPMAIEHAIYIALRPRQDGYVVVHSLDYDEVCQFLPYEISRDAGTQGEWAEYIKGVAWALGEAGYELGGWEGVVAGDIPQGAGLSSSAAIELATARAFCAVGGWAWEPAKIALICQRAENGWVGVHTGIMDQMISAAGVAGRALLIDCRTLATDPVPLPPDTLAIILDTSTRRELVTSVYNERRAQCETAAQHFGVKALRDVTVEQFEAREGELDPTIAKRARHVIMENARTLAAAAAMRNGNAAALGQLMNASHDSLRDLFEVTNDALNIMVEIAREQAGCYGARMTGAGFGGCAVALVAGGQAQLFANAVSALYKERTGLTPAVYVSPAAQGASVVT